MQNITDLIKKLNKNYGTLLVSLISFIGTTLYAFLINHLVNKAYMGYLSTFRIYSSYSLYSIANKSTIFMFGFMLLLTIILMVSPQGIYQVLVKNESNKFPYIKAVFINFLLVLFPWIIYSFHTFSNGIVDEISIIAYLIVAIIFSLTTSIISFVVIWIIYKNTSDSKQKSNLFISKLFSNKYIIVSIILSMLLLMIQCFENIFFEIGQILPNSIKAYPSFIENEVEYIAIAQLNDDNYLIIDMNSLQNKDSETRYLIKSIDNIGLQDKKATEVIKYLNK